MSSLELNEKVSTYFNLLEQIDELTAQVEAIKDTLKATMVERSTEELDGHGWRATWHNVSSTRFDSKAFKVSHADLYSAFSVKTTTTRFTLNKVKAAI